MLAQTKYQPLTIFAVQVTLSRTKTSKETSIFQPPTGLAWYFDKMLNTNTITSKIISYLELIF